MTSVFKECVDLFVRRFETFHAQHAQTGGVLNRSNEEFRGRIKAISASDNTQYTAKARTLLSSLKKNEQIRLRLQSGEVIPNRLATMPIHELASESLQKQREAAVTELVQSKQDGLYFDRVNKAQLFEANTGRAMSKSLFFCTKCKSNKTSNEQVQTRSGDEPMTVFVTCLDCGNHWKTS